MGTRSGIDRNGQRLRDERRRSHDIAQHTQNGNIQLAAISIQEARPYEAYDKVLGDDWYVAASKRDANGNFGCMTWINLLQPWALAGDRQMCPCASDIVALISETKLLVVRMMMVIYDVF